MTQIHNLQALVKEKSPHQIVNTNVFACRSELVSIAVVNTWPEYGKSCCQNWKL